MENYDIVIKNCQVLQPDMTISGECSVAIKDSWIRKIGSAEEIAAAGTAAQTLDGKGKLLMPGLVDGHTHTCQQLLRGRVADEYPMIWTRFLVPFESNLQPEDSYVSGQLACMEMIKTAPLLLRNPAVCTWNGWQMRSSSPACERPSPNPPWIWEMPSPVP